MHASAVCVARYGNQRHHYSKDKGEENSFAAIMADTIAKSKTAANTARAEQAAAPAAEAPKTDRKTWYFDKIETSIPIPKTIEEAQNTAETLGQKLNSIYKSEMLKQDITTFAGFVGYFEDGFSSIKPFVVGSRVGRTLPSAENNWISKAYGDRPDWTMADILDDMSKTFEKLHALSKTIETRQDIQETYAEYNLNYAIERLAEEDPMFKNAYEKDPKQTLIDRYEDIEYYLKRGYIMVDPRK